MDSPVMQSLMEKDRRRAEKAYKAWLERQKKSKTVRYGTVSKS